MAQTQETSEDKHVMAKILTLSDTHGMQLDDHMPTDTVDICIHAGDLTEESKLEEFKASLHLLCSIESSLKLVIAGNHDFTLDTETFRRKVHEAHPPLDPGLVKKFYGDHNEARLLFTNAANDGIHLLNEGTHEFSLGNGGKLRVYTSPYTPSLGQGAFQYGPTQGHDFDIGINADVVITHGPPRGILDRTASRDRAGSSQLFAAVAKAKPKLHCFGHIHEGWGAKLTAWRDTKSDQMSHLTNIDNDKSKVCEQLSTLEKSPHDTEQDWDEKQDRLRVYSDQKYCDVSYTVECISPKTLFVNAAMQGDEHTPVHLPWLVSIPLDVHHGTINEGDIPG